MNLFSNDYLIQNITQILTGAFVAFALAFFLTPLVARFATFIKAVDLPPHMRKKSDRSAHRKIHSTIVPKLGGLAMTSAIFFTLLLTNNLSSLPSGVLIGFVAIAIIGIIDDRYDNTSGSVMFLAQCLAASIVVISGISITGMNILGLELNFNWAQAVIQFQNFSYNFIFPADFLTVLWIVGLINVINWVGGVDGLNGIVSSIILVTMLLFILASGNIVLATIVGIHIGAIQGVFPYNYNPARIYYGSSGDYVNGYLLAIFAILGSTRWSTTLIVLALPIVDALIVIFLRLRDHPEARRNPLMLLSISDNNHLHHRLMRAGYSRKTVMLMEAAIATVICTIAIIFSDLSKQYIAFIIGIAFLFVTFSIVFFLMKRAEKNNELLRNLYLREKANGGEHKKEAVVKVVIREGQKEKDDYERFIY
jgi:UDP-GlcNAc:undecaprenyl-phosphate GlcNAc-1-phosphate transferase